MRAPAVLALLAVAALGAACGGHAGHDAPAGAPPAEPVATVAAGFNPTDAAWLQITIPMTRHLSDALDLAPERSGDPALRTLAATVREEDRSVLTRLDGLRVAAGLPDVDIHAGHTMPGMVTPEDVEALRGMRGAEFDARLRALLGAHLDHTIMLAGEEVAAGENPVTKALADALDRSSDEHRQGLRP